MSKLTKKEKQRRAVIENKISKAKEVKENHLKGAAEATKMIHMFQMEMLCCKGTPKSMKLTQVTMQELPELIVINDEGEEFKYALEDVPHEMRYAILNRNKDTLVGKLLDTAVASNWLNPNPIKD